MHPPRTAQDGTADPDHRRQPVPQEASRATPAEGPAAGAAPRGGSPSDDEPAGRTPQSAGLAGGTPDGSGLTDAASDRTGDTGRPPAGPEDGTPDGAVSSGPTPDGALPPRRTTGGIGAFDVREPARGGRHTDTDAGPAGTGPVAPPPPRASARFPDAPPAVGRGVRSASASRPGGSTAVPRQPGHRPAGDRTDTPPETPSEQTTRLRPVPAAPVRPRTPDRPLPSDRPRTPSTAPLAAPRPTHDAAQAPASRPGPGAPDPALSWSASAPPGGTRHGAGRPAVSFGEPEGYDENARPRPLGRRGRSRAVAAAVCLVLGTGLIGGAVTGSWLVGDSGGSGARNGFAAAGDLWHNVPVDQLFPPTVRGEGAGPGDADRTWTRIAVAPDGGCEGAFAPLLRKVLAPVGCARLLRATYTDATQSHVTTVGLLFTEADAAAMASLARRFDTERLDRRTDLMPLPYAAKDTAAAAFGARQRASWAISVLTDAPVVVYAVSGWADGRTVDTPQPAEEAMESGATTAPAQAGLGHEAQGLADRVERGVRRHAGTATERPS
ncbi:hypothetical protein GCM10010398_47250 [Streptomyces fimbriatus]